MSNFFFILHSHLIKLYDYYYFLRQETDMEKENNFSGRKAQINSSFDSKAPALKKIIHHPDASVKISHPSKAYNPQSHSELQLKRAADLFLHQEGLD